MRNPAWRGAVYYEIFVRSFQDSNGDGIGDLRGITERLNYLNSGNPADPNSLGIQGIWLTPIFKSPSYHGYDTTDFTSINPAYGTMRDFHELIRQAHARGIRVLLDLPINQTSIHHPWFIAAAHSISSPFHDWYCWMDHDPGWPKRPLGHWNPLGGLYYYSTFSKGLADLNWRNPLVRAELARIMLYWLAQGVDGFRLDAARYYVEGPRGEPDSPENHAAIRELISEVKMRYPRSLFLGEVWANARTIAPYVNDPGELDLAFHFPESAGLVASLRSRLAAPFLSELWDSHREVRDQNHLAPFLTNHDMIRLPSQIGGDPARLRLAAAALLTLPGTPFIYYGEEIGMPEGSQPGIRDDMEKRTPMLWTPLPGHGFTWANRAPWVPFSTQDPRINVWTQLRQQDSLLHVYQELIRLRQSDPTLSEGDLLLVPVADPQIAVYLRRYANEAAVVVLNFGADPVPEIDLSLPARVFPQAKYLPELRVLWGTARASLDSPEPGRIDLRIRGVPADAASIQKLTFGN